jgi:rhodanese-related sulfurtransferase
MRSIPFALFLIIALSAASCSRTATNIDTQPPTSASAGIVNDISPSDAAAKTSAAYSQFVDVRTAEEYASGHAERAINIPLDRLGSNLGRLEKNEPVYVICETGRRSREGAELLAANGFKWVFTVTGGTSEWREAGLPMETVSR